MLCSNGKINLRATSLALSFLAFFSIASSAFAAIFYIDPVNGSMSGDGSAQNPWSTLEEVALARLIETQKIASNPYEEGVPLVPANSGAPIKAGDTILLRSGYHGEFSLRGAYNESPITVMAEEGHKPLLRNVHLTAASNWIIKGLSISVSYAPEFSKVTLVDIENHSWHGPSSNIRIENCELFSYPDISEWSAQDWLDLSVNAIAIGANDCSVINNTIRNIRFGIDVGGKNALVSRNRITNFAGDGMRGLGDYSVFEYNTVENAFKIDENHDDGFQSWSSGENGVGSGVVKGIVLRGNTFVNTRNLDQPLRTSFQGIGCFDGTYEDWVIENNVVCVNHWHGITLMGAKNCRIVNNTVIDMYPGEPGPSWLRIANHKNGTPSNGNIVVNNLASAFSISSDSSLFQNNAQVSDPSEYFVNPEAYDFRLKLDSPAIGAGDNAYSPINDINGNPRIGTVDLGAHEFHGIAKANSLKISTKATNLIATWEVLGSETGIGYEIEIPGDEANLRNPYDYIKIEGTRRSLTIPFPNNPDAMLVRFIDSPN